MLFSEQFLQVCQISKESEEVRGNHLMIWHGITNSADMWLVSSRWVTNVLPSAHHWQFKVQTAAGHMIDQSIAFILVCHSRWEPKFHQNRPPVVAVWTLHHRNAFLSGKLIPPLPTALRNTWMAPIRYSKLLVIMISACCPCQCWVSKKVLIALKADLLRKYSLWST